MKIVNECINQFISLSEGYKEIDEIDELATEIIIHFASYKHNASIINRLNRLQIKGDLLYLNYDNELLENIVKDINKYPILKDFILKGNATITFVNSMANGGVVVNGNRIYIKLNTFSFRTNLEYQLMHANKHKDDNSIEFEECVRILRSSMGVSFRSVIIHELQHAYDYYRSDGKYANDKLSRNYYKRIDSKNVRIEDTGVPDEEFDIYIRLPHEYWARFSEAISLLSGLMHKDFHTLAINFKHYFNNYGKLTPKSQRKLLDTLYKYWDAKHNKVSEAYQGGELGDYHATSGHTHYWGNRGAGMIVVCGNEILLGLRSEWVNEPGTWSYPGGKIDNDKEKPEDAAMREVAEETGYTGDLHNIQLLNTFKDTKFKYFTYICQVDEKFDAESGWDAEFVENDKFGWFTLDNLPKPLHFGFKAILPKLKTYLNQ